VSNLNKKNLLGKKYGRLKVIRENGRFNEMVCWDCVCDCGKTVNVPAYYLTSGQTQSCGCLQRERTSKANTIHGDSKRKAESSLYRIYKHMIWRCENPNCKDYANYGGRGIKVCDEWKKSYLAFKEWALKNGYEPHLTIDRIDVNGDYKPSNCRWITLTEQENNRRDNVFLVFDGVRKTASQWAREYGVKPSKIYYRKRKGWSDDAIKNYLQAV
jgi:hypothetical protein